MDQLSGKTRVLKGGTNGEPSPSISVTSEHDGDRTRETHMGTAQKEHVMGMCTI